MLLSILAILVLIASFSMVACSKSNDEEGLSSDNNPQLSREESDYDDPSFINEEEDATLITISHKEEDFYGTWETKSEKAEYMYGNVKLKINDDHTWSGNITGEKLKGKWTAVDTGIIIKDADGLIYWNLFFVSDGSLMFKDLDVEDSAALVLKQTKK